MHLRMKTILALTAFVAVAWAIPHPVTVEWNEYKKTFGKFYTSEGEDVRRLNAYLATKQRVEEHNRKHERGETSYTMGINKFADWFPDELNKMNALKPNEEEWSEGRKPFELAPGVEVPEEINWVEKGAVTAVKEQKQCGSCYAFSAIGALEALMYLTNKTITDLSAQELVDCTDDYGNLACDGGYPHECFHYVADRKGISTEKSYPYEAKKGQCRAENGKIGTTCAGYVMLPSTEGDLKKAVGTLRPASVYFGAGTDFVLYKDGVFDGGCTEEPNHCMLAVGFGKDKKTGKDYWLVKNSWGERWGMKGYVKVVRGKQKCGIHLWNSYPVLKK